MRNVHNRVPGTQFDCCYLHLHLNTRLALPALISVMEWPVKTLQGVSLAFNEQGRLS